jgi:hypothetical protein
MKIWRILPVTILGLSGVLVSAGPVGATSMAYTCTGSGDGIVPPGTYKSMTITGVCYMPAGTITIKTNLTVAPGALLDATSPGDPAANPRQAATVVVRGSVSVGAGAVLFLGCSPFISCPTAVNYDRIGGSLTATGALGVVVHSVTIGGSFTLQGGGDGIAGPSACTADPLPWSEDTSQTTGVPVYSDAEDNLIGGNLSVSDLQGCWLGSLRNQVSGNATFVGNAMGDLDAMEIDNNLIGGSLACSGNVPAVQFGDSGSAPNMVSGLGTGQCGFKIILPNPAPEAHDGKAIREHIAVSTSSLGSYSGTQVQTSSVPIPVTPDVTSSGDRLVADMNTDVLSGSGLTGPGSGEFLATIHKRGSGSFVVADSCGSKVAPVSVCNFDGSSGTVTFVAYGKTSVRGSTSGTFLITSGGKGHGGLSTLAGYGTFSSSGQPAGSLLLVEFLETT